MNPWFKFYTEAVDDEKLRLLAFEDRWHFVALLCCKGKGILNEPNPNLKRRKMAVKLGLDPRTLDEVARRLAEVGLIDEQTLEPLAWDQRQGFSDQDPTNAERQRRFRERQRENKRNGDYNGDRNGNTVTVTPTEVEVEVKVEREGEGDKERRATAQAPDTPTPPPSAPIAEPATTATATAPPATACIPDEFETFWREYPQRAGGNPKNQALKSWNARLKEGHSADELLAGTRRYAAFCAATGKVGGEYVKQACTFLGPDKFFTEAWDLPTPTTTPHNGKPSPFISKQDRIAVQNEAALAEWLRSRGSQVNVIEGECHEIH